MAVGIRDVDAGSVTQLECSCGTTDAIGFAGDGRTDDLLVAADRSLVISACK